MQSAFRSNLAIVGVALTFSAYGELGPVLAALPIALMTVLYNILAVWVLNTTLGSGTTMRSVLQDIAAKSSYYWYRRGRVSGYFWTSGASDSGAGKCWLVGVFSASGTGLHWCLDEFFSPLHGRHADVGGQFLASVCGTVDGRIGGSITSVCRMST